MSDSLLDALDEISDDENSEEKDTEADAQDVNDALGGNETYWKSRNQSKKVQNVLRDDSEENQKDLDNEDEDQINREE